MQRYMYSHSDEFQDTLRKDIEDMKGSEQLIIPADKTRNLYKMPKDKYQKLLTKNVTRHYQSAPEGAYNEINTEAREIAADRDVADRMDVLAKSGAFLTLKDHKENFTQALPCRLINPAKTEVGVTSKAILDRIIRAVQSHTRTNLWKNSAEVIQWFKGIQDKEHYSFVCFEIVEFYPSISEQLLKTALEFAAQFTPIPQCDIDEILHARKSLLFANGEVWAKKDRQSLFDVTMGSFDGAEVCQLVGAFLTKRLADMYDPASVGLYRDDGLAVLRTTTEHEADSIRKAITKLFKGVGVRITISTNQRTVDFLDVTFDLASGRYHPYRKPNDAPRYINTKSNHPPNILRNLPAMINRRVSDISCDEEAFTNAAPA